MYFGLTPVEVRKLAFDITYKNNLNIYHSPGLENRWLVKNGCVVSWSDAMTLPFLRRKSSNIDWASCEFQRRFEEHAALFYVNLKIIRECNNFESKDIYSECGWNWLYNCAKASYSEIIAETSMNRSALLPVLPPSGQNYFRSIVTCETRE